MIDWDKPIQTRDGHEVRIYTRDGRGGDPVVGERFYGGPWIVTSWHANGQYLSDMGHGLDLVNVPEKHTRWINLYRYGDSTIDLRFHESKKSADGAAAEHRIACVKIEFTEGEGLEDQDSY